MTFKQRIEASTGGKNSLLCVGLDPRADTPAAAREECKRIIDATRDVAAVYKPNIAFFEVWGADGIAALKDILAHIRSAAPGTPVLLDAKRGDIPDTSPSYARAAFEELGADAVTVAPYIGGDGLAPFFERPEHGAFVLCKTSNPGADEFQNLAVSVPDGATLMLHEYVALRAQAWDAHGNIGLVVGATDPAAVARVRAMAPDLWLLLPGVGTQGGQLGTALQAGLRHDGSGVLINVSRSIARAADPRAEAARMRDEINAVRAAMRGAQEDAGGRGSVARTAQLDQLAADLLASGCVKFGTFTLKSGATSPFYIDLRRLVTYPAVLKRAARAYASLLRELAFDRIAGIPYAALPIGTAVALEMNRPLIYPRREAKEYGTKAAIEGDYAPGETAVVLDDLISSGESKFEAIEKLQAAGLLVRDVVVLIDRSKQGAAIMADKGFTLHAVASLPQLLEAWLRSGAITPEQAGEARTFLAA